MSTTHMERKRILAISGSTKSTSTSHLILKFIAEAYKDLLEVELYTEIATLPHFNPELEGDMLPAEVASFRQKIEQAEGVLFCTPEYVFSLPGSLKNAIEWNVSTTLFSHKPVALIVAAASGMKAFESLALIMTTIESILPDTSKLLIQGAKGKIDLEGKIKNQVLQTQIKEVLASLIMSIEDENRLPSKYRNA